MKKEVLQEYFKLPIEVYDNFIVVGQKDGQLEDNQQQTKDIFSNKWKEVEQLEKVNKLYDFQYQWFLKLYGFDSEEQLALYLKNKVIIDTGCGLGYKAA